jgi:hypothetical protein
MPSWLDANMRLIIVLAGVLLIVVVVGGVLYAMAPGTQPSSTTSQAFNQTGGGKMTVVSQNLTVGFHSGLWQVTVQNTGSVGVSQITIVLPTPTEAKVCTGAYGGLKFSNCPASPDPSGPLAPNQVMSTYVTGAGPGSATVGNSYNVTVTSKFADGTTSVVNATVIATSGA